MNEQENKDLVTRGETSRRSLLGWITSLGMFGALAAAYGSFGAFIARFLYPARPTDRGWFFVRETARLSPGEALLFRLPDGSPVHIRRQGRTGGPEDFSALSSTCPHLGCQVHWEAQNDRFFCPCHNGIFTPAGEAIAGPPADAGQSLLQYPLKVEDDLLFIQAPLETLVEKAKSAEPRVPCSPGARRA